MANSKHLQKYPVYPSDGISSLPKDVERRKRRETRRETLGEVTFVEDEAEILQMRRRRRFSSDGGRSTTSVAVGHGYYHDVCGHLLRVLVALPPQSASRRVLPLRVQLSLIDIISSTFDETDYRSTALGRYGIYLDVHFGTSGIGTDPPNDNDIRSPPDHDACVLQGLKGTVLKGFELFGLFVHFEPYNIASPRRSPFTSERPFVDRSSSSTSSPQLSPTSHPEISSTLAPTSPTSIHIPMPPPQTPLTTPPSSPPTPQPANFVPRTLPPLPDIPELATPAFEAASMADRLVNFLNSLDLDVAVDFVAGSVVEWVQNEPFAASRFAVNGASVFMRALSLRIRSLDEDTLPVVVRAFVDSIPVVCNNILDDEGILRLEDLSTTTKVISSLDAEFWTAHPYLQARLVGHFHVLTAFVRLVGDVVIRKERPVLSKNCRGVVLDNIIRILMIIASVGPVGRGHLNENALWKEAVIIWAKARDFSLLHENKIATILLTTFENFDPVSTFAPSVLTALEDLGYKASSIISIAFSRLHRAIYESTGEDADACTLQQLMVIRSLVDSTGFEIDASPFHQAFFKHKGFKYLLETLSYCLGENMWGSVNICLVIVVKFLVRTRSVEVFGAAFKEGLIRRLMEVSRHSQMFPNSDGHVELSFFLRKYLPESLFLPRIAELAEELQWEELASLTTSEFHVDWLRLMRLRERFAGSYKEAARQAGEPFQRCGNFSCNSIDERNRRHRKCAACMIQYYCCRRCQRNGWRYFGHRNECGGFQRAQAELNMEPTDVRLFMLFVQRELQRHIREHGIVRHGNFLGFRFIYGERAVPSPGPYYDISITEFVPGDDEIQVDGNNLPDLPEFWTGFRYSDFRATVVVLFIKNNEEIDFLFSCGFLSGAREAEEDRAN